jgi:hypothetical protein
VIHCSEGFDHFSMCSFSCSYCILYHRVLTDVEFTGELGHSGCNRLGARPNRDRFKVSC